MGTGSDQDLGGTKPEPQIPQVAGSKKWKPSQRETAFVANNRGSSTLIIWVRHHGEYLSLPITVRENTDKHQQTTFSEGATWRRRWSLLSGDVLVLVPFLTKVGTRLTTKASLIMHPSV